MDRSSAPGACRALRPGRFLACVLALTAAAAGCGGGEQAPELTVTIEPTQGKQGEEVMLILRGEGTDFQRLPPRLSIVEGTFDLSLGAIEVDNPVRARARLTVMEYASPEQKHTIQVIVGEQAFRFDFRVLMVIEQPRAYFEPAGRQQGYQGTIDISGEHTHFRSGRTQVIFPEEAMIGIDEVRVNSVISATMWVSISQDSPFGTYPATISTDTETVGASLKIYPVTFPILRVQPDRITQGSSETMLLAVENMDIVEGDLVVEFTQNRGLAVEEAVRLSGTTASAQVTAEADAVTGLTPISLTSGAREAVAQVRVLPSSSSAPSIRLYPTILSRGSRSVEMQVMGFGTHFQQGVTDVAFDPPDGIDPGEVTVLSPGMDRAVVVVDVDAEAPLETRDVIVTTGDEVARGSVSITEASLVSINAVPSALTQGDMDVTLTLDAVGISFLDGISTIQFPPISGILKKGELAVDPSGLRATAQVDVSPTAPTGSTLAVVRISGRDLEVPLTINPASGSDGFTLSPSYVPVPSHLVALSLTGHGTHWDAARHQAAVSDPSIDVVSFNVSDETSATVELSIPSWVDSRRCLVYVYSSVDIAAAWLSLIRQPQSEILLSLWPGESIKAGHARQTVFIQGSGTGFVSGVTRAEIHYGSAGDAGGVGEGLRVDGVNVIESGVAHMQISVFSTSVPGSYAVLLATGAEQGFGSVEVEPCDCAPQIRFTTDVMTAGEGGSVEITGTDMGFMAGVTRVRPASALLPGLTVPEASVSVSGPDALTASFISTTALMNQSIPVVVETDVVIAGRSFSFRESGSSPYLATSAWALRKGEETRVAMEGREGIDFAGHPPIIEPAGTGLTVRDVSFDETNLEFSLDVDEGLAGNIAWITVHSEDLAYEWSAALYAFDPAEKAQVASPALPFLSGSRQVGSSVTFSGMVIPDGVSPAMASVSGAAFVEDVSAAGPSGVDAVFDFAVSSTDAAPGGYLTMTGLYDGALLVPLEIQRADIQSLAIGSSITGVVPAGGPRYYDFSLGACSRILFSLFPTTPEEKLGYEIIGKSTSTTGIERMTTQPPSYLAVDSFSGGEFGYTVAIGDIDDAGKGYELALTNPWSEEVLIADLEPNETAATAQGIFFGRLVSGYVLNAMDVDYYGTGALPEGICGEVVSTRMSPSHFSYPFARLSLRDASDALVDEMDGNLAGDGMDPVLCTPPGDGSYYFVVEGVAGTVGPYFLTLRPEVLINELVFESDPDNFIELHCAGKDRCPGWILEIIDVASGITLESIVLDAFPGDGYWVLAQSEGVEGYDLLLSALGGMSYPLAVRVCSPSGSVCDAVQVGGAPAYGEGKALDAGVPAWRRLWHADVDDNEADFVEDRTTTPGS